MTSPHAALPIPEAGILELRETVRGFDREQLLWSSGYLAGLANAAEAPRGAVASATTPDPDAWTILYATETGNSRRIAESLAQRATESNVKAKLEDLTNVRPRLLSQLERAVFVVATHGLGDPPEGTEAFFEFWHRDDAPRLEGLEYSVLALGDSSYADFCEIGRRLDTRLTELGATRIAARVDCDVDFDDDADRWSSAVLDRARRDSDTAAPARTVLRAVPSAVSRSHPFASRLLANQRITGPGSSKDVRHIELDLASSGLRYLPGDSLGVIPENPPALVDAVLKATGIDGGTTVRLDDDSVPLAEALRAHREITALSRPFVDKLAARRPAVSAILDDRDRLREFFRTHQVIDLLSEWPARWGAQELVDALRKLPPRLYSIASSPDANPDEAHLTVAVVEYERFGRLHWGAASNFLAAGGHAIPVYVEANEQFRLPADPDTPIVMIGAGTGIAPYRAFVEHRREHGHRGDNWLIFGDRNFASDFLYQLEWLRYRKEGTLARIDVAFSRDGSEKVYVQHRIVEQARRLHDWLERGAHLYVCGDAERMAGDVNDALLRVLEQEAGLSPERSIERLAELKAGGRYRRDVY